MCRQSGRRGERAHPTGHAHNHQSSASGSFEIVLTYLTLKFTQYHRRAGLSIRVRANMDEETGGRRSHVVERPPEGRHTACEDIDVRIQLDLARKSCQHLIEELRTGLAAGHHLGSVT